MSRSTARERAITESQLATRWLAEHSSQLPSVIDGEGNVTSIDPSRMSALAERAGHVDPYRSASPAVHASRLVDLGMGFSVRRGSTIDDPFGDDVAHWSNDGAARRSDRLVGPWSQTHPGSDAWFAGSADRTFVVGQSPSEHRPSPMHSGCWQYHAPAGTDPMAAYLVATDADGRKSTGARLVDAGHVASVGRSGKVWTVARCADARKVTADAATASRKARNVKSVVKRQAQRRTAAIDKLVASVRAWNTLTQRQRQGATQSWTKSDAATRHAACVALGVGLRWATTSLATLVEHVGPATDRVLVDASVLAVYSEKRL